DPRRPCGRIPRVARTHPANRDPCIREGQKGRQEPRPASAGGWPVGYHRGVTGVRRRGALAAARLQTENTMRISLISAVLPMLFVCNVAAAQVAGMATSTPSIGAS